MEYQHNRLTGEDPDGVVTVVVDDAADVVSVRLAACWRDPTVRHLLGDKVVAAMRAATTLAMAKQADETDGVNTVVTVTVESSRRHVTVAGRQRQVDAVSADQKWLHDARVSEVESELRDALRIFAAMSGGHSALRQQVAADHLPGRVAGQRVHEDHVPGDGEPR